MKLRSLFILIVSGFIAVSCSKYQKVLKNGTYEEKKALAFEKFEEEDYFRAGTLFEELVNLSRGTKDAEKIQYYNAVCQYYQRQYILSAHHFKRFYKTYPRSEYAEEAHYWFAMSLYKSSPNHNLDQTATYTCIDAFQAYASRYPNSPKMEEINTKIDELQHKLEKKAYENAILYQKTYRYKAAVIAYENFYNNFPDSEYNEEIAFRKIESQYELAKNSYEVVIDDDGDKVFLRKNRYEEAIKFYYNFIDKYPNSKFVKEAENIYNTCSSRLTELNNNNL